MHKPLDSWGACLHEIMTEAHIIRGDGGQSITFICLCWAQKLPETLAEIVVLSFLGEHPQIPPYWSSPE